MYELVSAPVASVVLDFQWSNFLDLSLWIFTPWISLLRSGCDLLLRVSPSPELFIPLEHELELVLSLECRPTRALEEFPDNCARLVPPMATRCSRSDGSVLIWL